jgi:hypothetical protein
VEIKLILPPEKSNKTIGRPVVPFRKVLDAILYVLRTGYIENLKYFSRLQNKYIPNY